MVLDTRMHPFYIEAGATIKEVQTRLGHSSSKTTLDIYTHVTQSKKQEAAQKFANYIDL